MPLSYDRPRFIELHEQPWVPAFIRQPVQDILTVLWLTRIPPVQSEAPYQSVGKVLGEVLRAIDGDSRSMPFRGRNGEKGKEKERILVLDCCSGAGGPIPAIERNLNESRLDQGLEPISILLSDIQPHLSAWKRLSAQSVTSSLGFLPYAVDSTRAPIDITRKKHFRTFCLAFHHFDEEGAVRVLEDAMRTAEGIGIFELQRPDIGSLITITALFPLTLLLVPFQRPTWRTLLFTYIIPLIPLILVLDGYVSSWRTRSSEHIQYLGDVAKRRIDKEQQENGQSPLEEWTWQKGRRRHTWPFGYMTWIVGTKRNHE